MKKTLLITGVTGFIGQNLLEFIELNCSDIYNVILLSSELKPNYKTILHRNYTFSKHDFKNIGEERIDILIHVGAFIPKSGTEANDIKKSNSNIVNTEYLLNNIPNIPEKVIFLSSVDIYGTVETVIDEQIIPNPITMYGWSKLYCEKLIENWAKENNIVCQILRIGHIYGKGEDAFRKVIPVTIQKIKQNNLPQIFGKGNEKRSFLHVQDLCKFIIKSTELEKFEGVINVCSGKAHSIKEIVNMLVEISKKDLDVQFIENNNRGIDLVFNVSKMNSLLGKEEIDLMIGLEDEYNG